MELSNHQNISAALCVSFSVFFHPFHGVGHWAERGALHLHAPQTQPVAGDRGLPHSPLFVGSPEVEWVFTLHEAQALTLLLTSFTLSMSLLLYPGSILFPFFYLLEISHSFFLFLSNSASLPLFQSMLFSAHLYPLLLLLKLLTDFLCLFLLPPFLL